MTTLRPEQEQVKKITEELLEKNIILPSKSNYSSLVALVEKKDGEEQLFLDYRSLNKIPIKDNFPIPFINDLYLCATGFVPHNGLYENNYMPFGLANSPSTFQHYFTKVFEPLLNEKIMFIYIDDI